MSIIQAQPIVVGHPVYMQVEAACVKAAFYVGCVCAGAECVSAGALVGAKYILCRIK